MSDRDMEELAEEACEKLNAAVPGIIDYMLLDERLTALNRALALLMQDLKIPPAAIAEFVQDWARAHGASL